MLHKRIIIVFIIVCVTCLPAFNTNEHNVDADSARDFSVYFLRTHHPLSKFDSASFPSVEDIILARNFENEFLGRFEGSWESGILSESEYETSSEDKCMHNNGNCSHKCETITNEAICSCDEGFSLIDGTDCYPNTTGSVFLSGTSGKFMMNENDNAWIIKAPENHNIELEISGSGLDNYHYMQYSVYDNHLTELPRKLHPYYESASLHKFRSSGPYLYIKTLTGWTYYDTLATYKTGLPYFTNKHSRDGLSIDIFPQLRGLGCYSVTYNGYLKVSSPYQYSETTLTTHLSFMHHHMQWKTSIFRTLIHQEHMHLWFLFTIQSQVLMLRECLDIEASFWHTETPSAVCYNGGTWNGTDDQCHCEEGFSGKHCEKGLDKECENGGVWNGKYGSCMCPPGFVGAYCEEGCGANSYGENCAEVCSILSTECEGVIFCRANVCTCAPGFHGRSCDSPCSEGRYGASCHQYCGKCKDNTTCDIYTGKCYSGCVPGYCPPLCQQTYRILKSAPEIRETGYRHLKFRTLLQNQSGQGQPKFYEVQYKAEDEDSWSSLTPREISKEAELVIKNLLPGHFYSVRVILIDQDGGRCELNVPETKVMTKCLEPHQADYRLTAEEISENALIVEWSYIYDRSADFCLLKDFELSLMSKNRQLIFPGLQKDGTKILSGLLPNTNYRIQLTGLTGTGIRIPSEGITVHTLPADPGKVVSVQVVPLKSSRELKVTWQPPRNSAGLKMKYHISYTCVKVLACDGMNHASSTQGKITETPSVLLKDLQPHAVYQIEIAALSADGFVKEACIINTTTEHTAPQVAPSAAENPVLGITNVSASVTWLPPRDCALLNGYLYGYTYKLVDNETGQVMKENTIQENVQFVNFTDLKPNHCYNAQIAVVTSGGTDLSNRIVIPFCTSPTAPGPVQLLKVYKRSRKMVGLKWGRPLDTFGEIESFVVSYSEQGTDSKVKTTVEPQLCHAWNDFYCHTISHLAPARKYSFTVQARNDKVNADGEPASVEAVTTEGVSTAPVNLKVVNTTESSVTLEWQLPDNINGHLRSFVIMTGQVDSKGASDECCDSIPLADYRVTSEEPLYRYEINGLSPASTYSVTVAAKTLTLGEEAHIIAHTQSPEELLARNTREVVGTEDNGDSSDTVSLKLQPGKGVHGVKRMV
ncbi:tenascin-X-like [Schistocerca cancellata]|uniref:tenascin-X-like n=1 Tax=Schistocerca cancellata TaxID=274614 RepID=UPI002117BFCC|nr:tenascin-X-like [Schistocerca cancellata]XP_049763099.1 tenascin-X-like [Schistocerca cancellata]